MLLDAVGSGKARAREHELPVPGDRPALQRRHVAGAVVDADRKQAFLTELAEQLGIPQARTVAIGDGANDLRMIAAAGVGIAFCAKAVVREAAPCSLRTRRLDLVLALVGIGEDAVSDVPDPRA